MPGKASALIAPHRTTTAQIDSFPSACVVVDSLRSARRQKTRGTTMTARYRSRSCPVRGRRTPCSRAAADHIPEDEYDDVTIVVSWHNFCHKMRTARGSRQTVDTSRGPPNPACRCTHTRRGNRRGRYLKHGDYRARLREVAQKLERTYGAPLRALRGVRIVAADAAVRPPYAGGAQRFASSEATPYGRPARLSASVTRSAGSDTRHLVGDVVPVPADRENRRGLAAAAGRHRVRRRIVSGTTFVTR